LIDLGRRYGVLDMSAEQLETMARELEESEKSVAESMRELELLGREPTPEEQVMLDLVDRLSTRQGTVMPDFDALYKRKAELDHKRPDDEPPGGSTGC
jgi:hypothetical protein